jgi:excisionase family DNA binding protein
MLRVNRVAGLLDVTRKRVYQLVQEGHLEAVRLGPRQMRVLKDSVEAYIEGLRRKERIARGEEAADPSDQAPRRRQIQRVSRARRPTGYDASRIEAFFGEPSAKR